MSAQLVTPYAAAKLVNESLVKAGLTRKIPPQMMYNYTSARVNAGKVPFIETVDGKVVVESLEKWIIKYVAKQVASHIVETVESEAVETVEA